MKRTVLSLIALCAIALWGPLANLRSAVMADDGGYRQEYRERHDDGDHQARSAWGQSNIQLVAYPYRGYYRSGYPRPYYGYYRPYYYPRYYAAPYYGYGSYYGGYYPYYGYYGYRRPGIYLQFGF